MIHPRLSISGLSSLNWSFEQDLALWQELGVHHAGLMAGKLDPDRDSKISKLQLHGIQSSTLVNGPFDLAAPDTWDATRARIAIDVDTAAATGGDSVYITPGRADGRPWEVLFEALVEAIGPSVKDAAQKGVRLAIEPTLLTAASFVNTLSDAIDVAERTGVGLIVDFGNCWMERDLQSVIERSRPHIGLVQICDVKIGNIYQMGAGGGRVLPGEGELQIHRLMEYVLVGGYDGLFDLEVLGPAIEAEGYESVLRRGASRCSELLLELGL